MQLFTITIKALIYTYVPAVLADFTHSASIDCNRKTKRSLVRGRGTSILYFQTVDNNPLWLSAEKRQDVFESLYLF